jgi:D-sedoheptulose 7-phosphate isomerase
MRDWSTVHREHQEVIAALESQGAVLDAIADAIIAAFRAGRRVYTLGNGGSAADAQHIAAELLGRFKAERRAWPAVALSTDTSVLTAVGNDYDFTRVFVRQVEGLVQAGDILWALSTSGNSANVLLAAQLARTRGATVIGFTGQTGGQLATHCAHIFRAPHISSDRIQEAHLLAYHYICERIEATLA